MYRLISIRRLLPTFKFGVRSNPVVYLTVSLLIVFFASSSVLGAKTNLSVRTGETFTLDRERNSSFMKWKVTSFDSRKLSLMKQELADTFGRDRFQFSALEAGNSDVTLQLERSTVFGDVVSETDIVTVNVKSEPSPEFGQEGDRPTIGEERPEPVTGDDSDDSMNPDTQTQTADDSQAPPTPDMPNDSPDKSMGDTGVGMKSAEWDRAQELIEIGNYEEARNIIQKQLGQTTEEVKQKWHNKLANSFMEEGQYQQAVETWENMIEEYPKGPISRWLYKISQAHEMADSIKQQELSLLKIRHRHQNSPQWVDSMIDLGEIAITRGDYKRARNILEDAREPLAGRKSPNLMLQLAEIYDKYKPVRDYERAVNLYRRSAQLLDENSSKSAKQARKRARYLEKNYVNFGFD